MIIPEQLQTSPRRSFHTLQSSPLDLDVIHSAPLLSKIIESYILSLILLLFSGPLCSKCNLKFFNSLLYFSAHTVNDFLKLFLYGSLCTDNVSELTARINGDGLETVFLEWLKESKLSKKDAVLVFSVRGGYIAINVSVYLVNALKYSKEVEAKVLGSVRCNGGFMKQIGDSVIVFPVVNPGMVTLFPEGFHVLICQCFVSHPNLQIKVLSGRL